VSVHVKVDDIEFVKELYPRLREDDAAIERYRASLDLLPPIVVARGRVLVDGFHRWQAHRREGVATVAVEDLGNLTDVEIMKESVKRNASHGRQLETRDKKTMADKLWRQGVRDEVELCDLLSITSDTCKEYLRDAKRDEKAEQKAEMWDRWLNCEFASFAEAAKATGQSDKTVKAWLSEFSNRLDFSEPPESRQHFDVWSFPPARDDSAGSTSYFGVMPPQVVENLLWFYTEPGQTVVDPFAGSGTTIDVAKRMGRRVWASDRKPSTPTLPIHEHDITTGWPADAPKKADLVLLDPPYWQQAKGRYSDDQDDLGNMTLDEFGDAWAKVLKDCAGHLADGGRVAYIISPTQLDDGSVVDHATDMLRAAWDAGLEAERRIIVTYSTQQATGQQVEWARENKRLLKLYRDLVVLR
jgi:DNA modification methylase